ncbi:MAG: hypothetical protein ACRD3B_20680 [Candidatus Sulfotelmatobacter sp.]
MRQTAARLSARRPASAGLTFLVLAWLSFAGVLSAQAASPATITFSLDFPNSSPEHYSLSIQADGHAHYESSGKVTQDSDERDSYETDFIFSDATRAHIFDLASQAKYFSGKIDSGNKKIAFTGAKKLTYSDGQRTTSAEYNYSPVPAVQQLTNLLQSVSGTLEYGRRLTYFRRYQKLALDDELKRMEDQARRGELAELQAVRPVLQDIYDDNSVIKVGRARAHRIMEMGSQTVSTK